MRQEPGSEKVLVERVREGDRQAFAALIRPEVQRLIAMANRMLGAPAQAEECVQDALASVWVARARLDPQRPFTPFVTTVVLNKCRDRLRRRKVTGIFGFPEQIDDLSIADDTPNPEAQAIDRQKLLHLREALDKLPMKLREALVLVAVDERSQREAADILGVSEKTVETRVYRARKTLRKKFDRN